MVTPEDLRASGSRSVIREAPLPEIEISGSGGAAPGARLRTGLCRTLENAGDGLLDLIALEHIQTLLQVSSDCQRPFSAGAIGQASPIS